MKLRAARPSEASALTQIALEAKGHWGYDAALLKSWEPELTYTPEYIESHWVWVAEEDWPENQGQANNHALGVCSLDPFGDQLEIGGLWVRPNTMGRGVGRQLLSAALDHCRKQGVTTLRLLSDPNAFEFYRKLGGKWLGYERGSSKGRLLPLMHFYA